MSCAHTTGLEDYDQPEKRHWSLWKWNTIKKALKQPGPQLRCRPGSAIVVYLPGPEDLERPKILRAGFREANLFGCERNDKAYESLRSRTKRILHMDLAHAVAAWSPNHPLNVIDADFTGNLTRQPWDLFQAILHSRGLAQRCIVSMNIFRGREGKEGMDRINNLRSCLVEEQAAMQKHRGFLFINGVAAGALLGGKEKGMERDLCCSTVFQVVKLMAPQYGSYRSICGKQGGKTTVNIYDSVIFSWFPMLAQTLSAPDLRQSTIDRYRRSLGAHFANRTREIER